MDALKSPQVIIVGAGPVGLFLGCRLAQLGISFIILEKRTQPNKHSRSIGVHPPALELFELLGLVDELISAGVVVERGHAFAGNRPLGQVSFERCKPPYTFVLAVPQHVTERLLTAHLERLAPGSLRRGAELLDFTETPDTVQLRFEQNGKTQHLGADFLVGCDGHRSFVRQTGRLGIEARAYPDTYLMGDFLDNTRLGNQAGIFLTPEGVVESFPLPHSARRWVAKTPQLLNDENPEILARLIHERLSYSLPLESNTMLSSFRVQQFQAKRMARGRLLLAGDAGHVVSPIGGQGMNLGWLDAWEAAESLYAVLIKNQSVEETLERYHQSRCRSARRAARRAELNMRLGRSLSLPTRTALWVALKRPFQDVIARLFTMRWL